MNYYLKFLYLIKMKKKYYWIFYLKKKLKNLKKDMNALIMLRIFKKKYALETKLLNKENKDLENKYEISLLQLKENEQKNKNLLIQINEQKKEVVYIKN